MKEWICVRHDGKCFAWGDNAALSASTGIVMPISFNQALRKRSTISSQTTNEEKKIQNEMDERSVSSVALSTTAATTINTPRSATGKSKTNQPDDRCMTYAGALRHTMVVENVAHIQAVSRRPYQKANVLRTVEDQNAPMQAVARKLN